MQSAWATPTTALTDGKWDCTHFYCNTKTGPTTAVGWLGISVSLSVARRRLTRGFSFGIFNVPVILLAALVANHYSIGCSWSMSRVICICLVSAVREIPTRSRRTSTVRPWFMLMPQSQISGCSGGGRGGSGNKCLVECWAHWKHNRWIYLFYKYIIISSMKSKVRSRTGYRTEPPALRTHRASCERRSGEGGGNNGA